MTILLSERASVVRCIVLEILYDILNPFAIQNNVFLTTSFLITQIIV